jgi:hypothetical protein
MCRTRPAQVAITLFDGDEWELAQRIGRQANEDDGPHHG